ncbi:aminotransferase class V-fold PLP-dependent enzyme [Aestuariispira insulae]|uniref:Isopenicillin-N epimerase n=1 Tax=Aestuariispira insulae TaxID=1461337 RepID=A0A3D9HEX4_9PROT|nr:aminotransferase class V-fold PLP-dependent enzyme [Aestuariispira insulae]RED48028.1 isopenicillin-N epimerase [Aestuariispira insulae]
MNITSNDSGQAARMEWGRDARKFWYLEEECTYLNHGAYGAISRPVMEAAEKTRHGIERQPTRYLREELIPQLRGSASLLGSYLGGNGEDLVFVDNATTGVNAILRSLALLPGDEIVTTDHCYGAVLRTLEFVAERAGARIIYAKVPFPVRDPGDATEAIVGKLSPRTRLVVIDHVTSPTAVKLPIADIIDECQDRAIPVLVDGAHAPGMLNLKLNELGATWYVGNAHKWLGAPRGCGFIWTDPDRQHRLRPTTISHFIGDGYNMAFDWPGTKDFTPYLSIKDAIVFRAGWGEKEIYQYCRTLVRDGANLLSEAWGTERGESDRMSGFMATVAWPGSEPAKDDAALTLIRKFRDEHGIEVAVKPFAGKLWVRTCAYIYSELGDFEKLANAGRAYL